MSHNGCYPKICAEEGCAKKSRKRGLCEKHYGYHRRYGTLPEKVTRYTQIKRALEEDFTRDYKDIAKLYNMSEISVLNSLYNKGDSITELRNRIIKRQIHDLREKLEKAQELNAYYQKRFGLRRQ